jgi:hypothetical protein
MSSDQISILRQRMFVAHGVFHDAIAAYRAAQHTHAPAEVVSQAAVEFQVAGERLDRAISILLHHLHGVLRSEEGDAVAEQAQRFRDQLRAECHQLTEGQE